MVLYSNVTILNATALHVLSRYHKEQRKVILLCFFLLYSALFVKYIYIILHKIMYCEALNYCSAPLRISQR